VISLDVERDGPALTADLVDVPSVSGTESALAGAVERALRGRPHLEVERRGDTVIARTATGRPQRVVIAGHLDTVPEAGNLPARRADGWVHGLGSCDMKGGLAVMLRLAASVATPVRDVTYVFYEGEEVEEARNGLYLLQRDNPGVLAAGFAVLMEPSGATVEAGCQGSLRADVTVTGRRAHTARAWMGDNAIHAASPLLARLAAYEPRRVLIDGLEYREGLSAVAVSGGVAGNVVPDRCVVTVNHRFAPDRDLTQAFDAVRSALEPYDVALVDGVGGAPPGLRSPAAAEFVRAIGREPRAKLGWTDVARFAALGVPAVNYGPGDPTLAHTPDERVPEAEIVECEDRLRAWLTGT
jgi:succinyl-diaminopimelate desuccinylase